MPEREITLGHSPDPDDAFMFYALATGQINTGDLRFVHILQDIETLNRRAMHKELDITAVSIHAYAYIHEQYGLLPCGASIGDGYGPMVVARSRIPVPGLHRKKIAVPGELTTAFLALRLCLDSFDYEVLPFDEILDAVANERCDAGLIIHEGQLTYGQKGLVNVLDLGAWWKEETGLPLPLGANVIRRSLGAELIARINRFLKASILYALEHRKDAVQHSLPYARDMNEALADKFVGMYVNDYTLDYGEEGRRAVVELLERGHQAGVIPHRVQPEFVI
ncbi:MAG: MqnA/MqnD/SBP family protein [bacterium]